MRWISEHRGAEASQKETEPTLTEEVPAVTVAVRVRTEPDAIVPFSTTVLPLEPRVSAVVVLAAAAHAV
jgi:hypothetical protein